MFLQHFSSTDRKAHRNPLRLGNDRTPTSSTYTATSTNTLSDRDSVRPPTDETESSHNTDTLTEESEVATPDYIYYRIFVEDGAIPSKAPATPDDPFLGCIKAKSVPPPYRDTAQAVKRTIAKVEKIENRTNSSLFLTPYSQSPMGNTDKAGWRSTSQEPLAFVARISDSERSALESGGRDRVAAEPEFRYLYYLLYVDDYDMPSKVAIDPEEPSLGRIQIDSISPPHSPATIKACISRVEKIPELAYANLFADISSNHPLKESYISILRNDCPGLSPKKPMVIVQTPPVPDGRYAIKSRAADNFWLWNGYTTSVHFGQEGASKDSKEIQWNITLDANGNISMSSPYAPSLWVGTDMTVSTVPVPWRLIRVDSKFFYLTTDMNRDTRNPRVPAAQPRRDANELMGTLKEGDRWQMWEFVPI